MRQHVNPLSHFFQVDREIPELQTLYENEELPLHIDIGCARGNFLIKLAELEPHWNYLGLDIRSSLISAANRDRDLLELRNLAFFFCNANVSLQKFLGESHDSNLKRVSIQFPDPWFKRRHYKRKVFQLELISLISCACPQGAQLFIQSDILSIIEEMELLIYSTNCFFKIHPKNTRFIGYNPFKIKTEREDYVMTKGLPIYRILFERNSERCPNI